MLKSWQGFKQGLDKLMKDYPPRTLDTDILLLAQICELEKKKSLAAKKVFWVNRCLGHLNIPPKVSTVRKYSGLDRFLVRFSTAILTLSNLLTIHTRLAERISLN